MTDRTAPSAGPFAQESPMSKTDRHAELVALLNKISDRLPEPEGVNAALDWLDEPAPVPRPEPAPADDGWTAKHAALRADVEGMRERWLHDGVMLTHFDRILARDAERTPQPDPDTVTLRRDDVEAMLKLWVRHSAHPNADAVTRSTRAALG